MVDQDLSRRQAALVHSLYRRQILMEVRGRFQLKADPGWFLTWLKSHLDERKGSLYPGNYDSEYVSLQPDARKDSETNCVCLSMTGVLWDYEDKIELGFKPVVFEIAQGHGEHTEVKVWVRNFLGLVEDFLTELMTAIADKWPEALDLLEIATWSWCPLDGSVTWIAWQNAVDTLAASLEHPGGSQTELAPIVTEASTPEQSPWDRVPDRSWDREALELWWQGCTVPGIAGRLHLSPKTVRNKLSSLRKRYGESVVPTADQLRAMGRR